MKKHSVLFIFLLLCTVWLSAQTWTGISSQQPVAVHHELISSNQGSTIVRFEIPGFFLNPVSTPRGKAYIISVPKMVSMLETGFPDIPQYGVSAIIPDLALMKVRVLESSFTDFSNIEVAPSKGNFSRQIDPESVPYTYGEIYSKNALYPDVRADLREPFILRDYRGQTVMIYPFSYNAVTKVLRVYHELVVEIYGDGLGGENQFVRNGFPDKMDSEFKYLYQSQFINANQTRYPALSEEGNLLIICHGPFMQAMQPFVQWKKTIGRPTEIVDVATIGTTTTAIKAFVTTYYNNKGLTHLLLVGDHQHVPSQAMSGGYSDYFYGYLTGNDSYNEVFVGRFSAETVAHVETQVQKVIYYERDIDASATWLNVGLGMARNEGAGGGHNGGEADYVHMDFIRDSLLHYTYATVHREYDGGVPNTPNTTAAMVSQRINEGVSILNYCNHGSISGWSVAGFSNSHVNALANSNKLPVVWSVACDVGNFTGSTICFAEHWMRAKNATTGAPTGALGGKFSWISQPWQPPMTGQDEMVTILVEGYLNNRKRTLGGNSTNGSMKMIDLHGSSGRTTHDTWILFGDPSLTMRTANPTAMTVSHLPAAFLGSTSFTVNANAENAIVSLTKDGEILGTGYVTGGSATVNFSALNQPGVMTVAVFAYNRVTYLQNIDIIPMIGPYILLSDYSINDAGGNNNGLADYGENISLNINLKNVGTTPSAPVVGIISGTDPYVSFTGPPAQNFGIIANGQTITMTSAYSFSIANIAPNQHRASFTLSLSDGSDTWNSFLRITVQAPVMSIPAGYLVDDSQGGNNNGILDPGETGLIKVNITNTGNSAVSNILLNISANNPMLTINTPVVNVANLGAGQTREASFSASASANSTIGNPVNVGLSVAAGSNGQYTATQSIVVVIGQIPDYTMANATITTCVGTFYDSGGPSANYSSNENLTLTFLPHTNGAMIRAKFLSFDVETNNDKLFVYNGPNTSAPQIAGSPFSGTISPGTITAQNALGAITFRFTSDASITRVGWKAEVSCHTLTVPPACATNPSPANGAVNVSLIAPLSWAANEAHEVDLYFGPTPNPPLLITTVNTSFSPPKEPNTTYYWKIVPKNTIGAATTCQLWSFTTGGPSYLMSNSLVQASSGMFYDSGGPSSNYGNSENFTMTFKPLIEGVPLRFAFSAFDTENIYDKLFVYNGPDATAPEFTGSPFAGINSPGVITSTHASGAITFRFISDIAINKPGWVASFQMAGNLSATPAATPAKICKGDFSLLRANVIGGSGNYTYSWTPPAGLSNPNIANPIASPEKTVSYTLTVSDGSTQVSGQLQLVVNQPPQVNLGADTTICVNNTIVLDATVPNAASYLWSPGGQTTPMISVNSAGIGIGSRTYSVLVTDINGCQTQVSRKVTFDACTYIEDVARELSISVYPNPTGKLLNLQINGKAQALDYTLLNHHGQVFLRQQIGSVQGNLTQKIDLGSYARGIYYLRINTDKEVFVKKIVLQ